MAPEVRTVTQTEIDALLVESSAEPVVARISATDVPASSAPADSPSEPRAVGSTIPAAVELPRLDDRLRALEAAAQSVRQMAATVSELGGTVQQLREEVKALAAQSNGGQDAIVEEVSAGLRATPGYGLRKTFTCRSCQTAAMVAVRIKCTQCGEESWWGWYPQRQ